MKRALLVLAIVSSASAQPPPPSAATVLANVQKYYANVKQMAVQFRQAVTYATFNNRQTSDGQMWVVKPSQMRWDYLAKRQNAVITDKSFVVNGQTVWIVDHKNKQIGQGTLQGNAMPAAISFVTGTANLASQFTIALSATGAYGVPGTTVLELTPKQPSAQYKQLFFVVDLKDWHINESVVVDANGNTNDFKFYTPNLQPAIQPQLFTVNPASLPNYRVVQQSSLSVPPPAAPPPSPAPTKKP